MEARELRIGNNVYLDGRVISVSITDLSCLLDGKDSIREFYQPIPLKKSVLNKLGLLSYRDNVKWIHQLQNLYFAMNGEELELKF